MKPKKKLLNQDELILYAAWRVIKKGKICTTEKLTAECFKLFPKHFQLKGYPQWPDSRKVDKRWWSCRSRGWLTGGGTQGLALTPAGEILAKNIEMQIKKVKVPEDSVKTDDNRCENLICEIKKSKTYKLYTESGELRSEFEIKSAFGLPYEAPKRLSKTNLHQALSCAKMINDKDVIKFIKACEKFLNMNIKTLD